MFRSKTFFQPFIYFTLIALISACGDQAQQLATLLNNNAPTITGTPGTSIQQGNTYSFTPIGADADGDPLTFSIKNKPSWATFNGDTGNISGTPGNADLGLYNNIVITVSDGSKSSALPAFSILVFAPSANNQAPTISGTPTSQVTAGNAYSFKPSASDPNNDTLVYQIINLPSWATFNSSTGELSGTPQANNVGIYNNIEISVSDGELSATLMPFSITVVAAPVQQTQAEVMVSYNANLSNAIPLSGATLDSKTVYIFFKEGADWSTRGVSRVDFYCCKGGSDQHTVFPSDTTAPYSVSVNLSQYDSSAVKELYADVFFTNQFAPDSYTVNFMITPSNGTPANNPPTITGIPATSIATGNQYSFAPTASDIDGDTLTFSITNKPAWASFNTATGALSGTPATAGMYSNIVISVSDGTASVSLASFNIVVTSISTLGTATLSWTPPTQYTDNTPLSNLAGYVIYYGNAIGNYPNKITLNNPGLTEYIVENLTGSSTYYFVVTAFDNTGIESDFSNVVTKNIP